MPNSLFYQQETATEIIGREPTWIVRSGIGLISLITIFLLIITWFIQYPDSISAPVTLQTKSAIVKHRAKLDGHLEQIMFKDGGKISKGQPIALIESQLDYGVLLQLEEVLKNHALSYKFEQLLENITAFGQMGQLVELQEYFGLLVHSLRKWSRLSKGKLLHHQQYSINATIDKYNNLMQELTKKQQTLMSQLALIDAELERKKALVKKSLLAANEVIKVEQSHLTRKSQLNDIKIELHLYQIKINELYQGGEEAQIIQQEELELETESIQEHKLLLLSKIREWKQKHMLISQISGTVSFNQAWKLHQFVNLDDTLFTVIPSSQQMDAWMMVSGNGVGKIKPDQYVQIELENYPSAEFGLLEGKVVSINKVPNKQGYLVKLSLPDQLISNYGVTFADDPFLKGRGKIITKPRRLFTRFTDKITYAFDQIGV